MEHKAKSELAACEAQQLCKTASEASNIINVHKEMWRGVSMSSDEVKAALEKMKRNHATTVLRVVLFNKSMVEASEKLLFFASSIDQYLFFLSKTDYFPSNFDIRSVIGIEEHKRISQELQLELLPAAGRGRFQLSDDVDAVAVCHHPEALFEMQDGQFVHARRLKVGDLVRASQGGEVTVSYVRVHPAKSRHMVELWASAVGPLVVTAEHRVVVPGPDGSPSEKLARDLLLGTFVMCSTRDPLPLTQVAQKTLNLEVVELKFDPDQAVAVHLPPVFSILTLGQSRRRIRRGGRAGRRPGNGDALDEWEIPSTELAYSD